jgi:hypothetical protein
MEYEEIPTEKIGRLIASAPVNRLPSKGKPGDNSETARLSALVKLRNAVKV